LRNYIILFVVHNSTCLLRTVSCQGCVMTSRNEIHDTKQNTGFHALCGLYVLSVVVVTLDTGIFVVGVFVSNNAVFFRANQLCAQTNADAIFFHCCDFLA
jgi:hypothetical protein